MTKIIGDIKYKGQIIGWSIFKKNGIVFVPYIGNMKSNAPDVMLENIILLLE